MALNVIENARAIIRRRHAMAAEAEDSRREMEWLQRHRHEYAGKWVALKGGVLLAAGASAADVYKAIAGRADVPLVTQLQPEQDEPFAGW